MRIVHRLLGGALVSVMALGFAGLPLWVRARERLEGKPFVIGHRGASGYLPEHTLEAYALTIDLGADFVEPDLVITKDSHLIARHEPNMIATTDVKDRPEFAARKRTAVVDGFAEEGWFASDFTLAEIKTLRAVQAFGEHPQQFNGQFEIPTLEEVIQLAKRKGNEHGRFIGIYPETKHPTYHRSIGLPLEPKLVQVIRRAGLDHRTAPVFIRSFEQSNLELLRTMTRVRLVQLIGDENGDGRIDEADRQLLPPTEVIERAHRAGQLVHTWTFRNEQRRLAAGYQGNPVNEYLQFYELGVDGMFSDFPDTAFAARALFNLSRSPSAP